MYDRIRWTVFILAIIYTTSVAAGPEILTGVNNCVNKQTCRECIQTPYCVWCTAPDVEKRCFMPSINTKLAKNCQSHTVSPDTSYHIIRNESLSKGESHSHSVHTFGSSSHMSGSGYFSSSSSSKKSSSAEYKKLVQVTPQEINLKIRMNEAYKLNFQYKRAEDYPVDLYYLMDLSNSMKDDKIRLSSLGSSLVETMQKLTSNFRLGFGSFVDKVVMPYVSIVPDKLREPCSQCAAPYGFKHVMSLSNKTGEFATQVNNSAVSGNLDAPEGGFDALMQAIVCKDIIGWREQARRLIVFSTDADFHFAGDGKLGGIVKPNDGECHMDNNGYYSYSKFQDYPSISQINRKVKENSINIIWAVTVNELETYKELKKHVQGSTVGSLDIDSANIVKLIEDQYHQITSSVEFKDTAQNPINIQYYTKGLGTELKKTNKCDNLTVGDVVEFTAEITVTQCPANKSQWHQSFIIYPVGISESIKVNLEMICDCECERNVPEKDKKSSACSNAGTLKCGICECNENYFGKRCECNTMLGGSSLTGFTPVNNCRRDNSSLQDCSGRGSCSCGQCECEKRLNPNETISGDYCECDNFSCDRDKGLLCSGIEHGECICGKCKCNPGWTGPSCDCLSSTDSCIAPGATNGLLCSGHGECKCGKCECHTDDVRYTGKFCNKCPTCPSRCEELKPCVQCQVYGTGNYSDLEECAKNCKDFIAETKDVITPDVDGDEIMCYGIDEDDCKYTFVYYYNETNVLHVVAQKERECPPQVFMLGIVLGVIAAVVLIGLALLFAWKAWTIVHDRREFVKFEKERMMAKWDTGENPIYKQATSTFKNPMYTAKS